MVPEAEAAFRNSTGGLAVAGLGVPRNSTGGLPKGCPALSGRCGRGWAVPCPLAAQAAAAPARRSGALCSRRAGPGSGAGAPAGAAEHRRQ